MQEAGTIHPIKKPRVRLRDRLVGHIRKQFLCEYKMLRRAGLRREQALALCLQRYGKRDAA